MMTQVFDLVSSRYTDTLSNLLIFSMVAKLYYAQIRLTSHGRKVCSFSRGEFFLKVFTGCQ